MGVPHMLSHVVPRCTKYLARGSSVVWRCMRPTAAVTKGGNLSKWGKLPERADHAEPTYNFPFGQREHLWNKLEHLEATFPQVKQLNTATTKI